MLPDADNGPLSSPEFNVVPAVASNVSRELGIPVVRVRSRSDAVVGATVPEAAVDEDRGACGGEYDVRAAADSRLGTNTDPIPHTSLVEFGTEAYLGPRIRSLVALHDRAH